MKEKIEIVELQKLIKKKIRQDIWEYDNDKINAILEEDWSTRKVKKELSEGRNLITNVRNKDGVVVYGRDEIMKTITEFYENLYHNQETVGMENWFRNNTDESFLSFLVKEIEVVLSKLKSGKADRPYNISNETLKIFGEARAPYLTKLFNDMVEKNWVPSQWKLREIILLFKKGEREDINNYKPITLSSNLSKVFMAVLKNRIYNTLEENQSKE